MAFKIPEKAFLSFGRKQCLDTLWRIGGQLEQHWNNETERELALNSLDRYLVVLKEHEDSYLSALSLKLAKRRPKNPRMMQEWLMLLEREIGLDLKDSDFLVSTVDRSSLEVTRVHPIHLVLDNLRSSFNVGSLFRTAEALGIQEIHLCGYSPTPENSKTAKSALGTEDWIKWRYWENTLECVDWLHQQDITTYAFETEANAQEIAKGSVNFPCAIILGNERYGLGEPILRKAHHLIKIDLFGKKNSLNVGICGAMAMHHFIRQID